MFLFWEEFVQFNNLVIDIYGLDAKGGICISLNPLGTDGGHFLLQRGQIAISMHMFQIFDGVSIDRFLGDIHLLMDKPSIV